MNAKAEPSTYHVYVLRLWREGEAPIGASPVWRYSLEDPVTRQRRGFADLAALTRFLAAEAEMEGAQHDGRVDEKR